MAGLIASLKTLRQARALSKRYFTDTSLLTKWLYIRRQARKLVGRASPIQLWLGMTYRCQCRCVHCCQGPYLGSDVSELSEEQFRQLIDVARRLGALEVVFFGGEPLLRRDTISLIAYARRRGMLSHLFTNGILLDEERTRALKEAGLFRVNISIDAADAEEHDERRRLPGCYEKAIAGIRRLVALNIRCIIWTYASKRDVAQKNMSDLEGVVALGKELGVNGVYVCFPVATGNWACGQHEMLTLEERGRVRVFQSDPFVELEFPEETSPCRGGIRMLYVSPDGRLSPCPCIPYIYGDVRKEPLDTIAKRMWKEMRRYQREAGGQCIMQYPAYRRLVYGDEAPAITPLPCMQEPESTVTSEQSE